MIAWKRLFSFALLSILWVVCFAVSAAAADDVWYGVGYVTMDHQRLYSKPNANSAVLDTVNKYDCVILMKESDDYWFKVLYNDQHGYLYAGCLDIHTEENVELGIGKINSGVAYLRSGPGTEYSIVSSGFKGNEHAIIGLYNGFYKILKDDETCYIRTDLMNLTEIPYQNAASETSPEFYYLGEEIGEITFTETEPIKVAAAGGYHGPVSSGSLLSTAQQFIGVPYVFGGTSPDGFDCSGLVFYSLSLIGYPAPRTAAAQYGMGYSVGRDELQAGDLVFFENTYTSGISHVGIYAGGGSFLHAPNDGGAVSYSSLSGYWADHYCGARRLG